MKWILFDALVQLNVIKLQQLSIRKLSAPSYKTWGIVASILLLYCMLLESQFKGGNFQAAWDLIVVDT